MPYNPHFLQDDQGTSFHIPLPRLMPPTLQESYNNGEVIEHTRFSLVFNAQRNLAVYVAYNIDGRFPRMLPRRDDFRLDPNIPGAMQIDNDRGYRNNRYDRGHLARRGDLGWGTDDNLDEAMRADSESYFYSNIAPQLDNLHSGPWGKIEDWIFGFSVEKHKTASVFTGPIFTNYDETYQSPENTPPIKIPSGFWKIVTKPHGDHLFAAGFIVWQKDFDESANAFNSLTEQVRVTTIEYLTGLDFGLLRTLDVVQFGAMTEEAFRVGLT